MSTKVRFSFRRTLQLVEYEPIQFGVDFETDGEPGEDTAATVRRAYEATADIYNEVQADLLESYKQPRATIKTCKGGVPPKIAPSTQLPPKPKKD